VNLLILHILHWEYIFQFVSVLLTVPKVLESCIGSCLQPVLQLTLNEKQMDVDLRDL